jgi:hypothetical protein
VTFALKGIAVVLLAQRAANPALPQKDLANIRKKIKESSKQKSKCYKRNAEEQLAMQLYAPLELTTSGIFSGLGPEI